MNGDASEVRALAADLSAVSRKMVAPVGRVMADAGIATARQWADIARGTSGVHGKHYPNSIDSEARFTFGGIEVEVGPNSAKPQGGMGRGFEFGSVNQPPHLDGAKALDAMEPRVGKIIDSAIGNLLP